jgi:succinoglycan biosynthesis transport protein ExoP
MTFNSPAPEDARIDIAALLAAIVRRLPRILLVTLALLVAGFVLLMFQPRLYESNASILVEPRASVYLRASGEQAPTFSGNTVGVVSSQIELLKSRDTLLNVIDQLDLRSVAEFNGGGAGASPFDMITQLIGRRAATPNSIDETVLNILYQRLTATQERDSAIISVGVSSTDPQLAADIANAVANAHVARRADLSISDTAEASGWLLDEINRLRVSVQEAESAVADFRVENDLFVGQNNTSLLDQQLSTVASQITTAQERKNTALTRAALIRGLIDSGQPIEGVADVRNSLSIQQLSQEKARLQGELAQRSATLLSSHPAVRALNAQIAELDNQIRQEGRRVATALEAEAQIEADLERSLQADLDRAKASASTATRDTVTLDSLQREAKAQRDLLEAYLLRYNEASSRVDSNSALPDVRVVSVAAPAVTPSSPKTSLIMVAIGFVSIAVQVGAVALGEVMSGRALAPVARPQDELDSVPFDENEMEDELVAEEPDLAEAHSEADAEGVPQVEPELQSYEPVLVEEPESNVVEIAEVRPQPVPDEASDFVRSLLAETSVTNVHETETDDPEADEAEMEDAEPVARSIEALPATPAMAAPRSGIRLLRYADLVSDLVLGRTHLLLLADHGEKQPSRYMAEELISDALAKGLSVALVDAGTGRRTNVAGITDLSAGTASFGDVVQKSADNSFAEVSWGQGDAIARTSNRPLVLTEALADIYEVVVVLTGRVDRTSMLGTFSELGGRVILVASDEGDADNAESTRKRLEEAGLSRVEIAALAEPVAA